jgi:hypothetical protein
MDDRYVVRALLVGDNPEPLSLARQILERNGCECYFAESLDAAKDLLQLWQFEIVLSTHRIPSDTIQRLIGLLSGTSISLFSSLRVQEGSWWLPVLQFGKECYEPVLRVGDLVHVLDDFGREVRH